MRRCNELYVGWQAPDSRRWYPVGALRWDGQDFIFQYLRGAVVASRDADFRGLAQFPDFERTYRSNELFSFFQNRVISATRPDAEEDIRRLGLEELGESLRDFDILSRSYGRRTTDRFEIYPPPATSGNHIELAFFTRGVRHCDEETRERWQSEVSPSEPIRFVAEPDNPADPNAQLVVDADGWNMGYLPWYYTESFAQLLDDEIDYTLSVRRHNPDPSYPQHRFLMEFRGEKPPGWSFPQSSLYDSIDATSSAPEVA